MTRLERWALHLAALATALTGLAYGWARYFGQRQGEFGPEPHPLQGLFQHGHVLASPILLFALGVVIKGHALPALRARRPQGRFSGWGLLLLLAPLALSGYTLQVCVDPRWRNAIAWCHGPLGLTFLLAYAAHFLTSARHALQRRPCEGMMEAEGSRSSAG